MLRKISIILILSVASLMILQNPDVYAQEGAKVDIAKYAKQIERNEKNITILWEEPRNVFEVVVKSSNPVPLANAKLQYWNRYWPKKQIPEGEIEGGSSGWIQEEDWFTGDWKDADIKTKVEGNSVIFSFNPLNAKEFINDNFDMVYRRSLKIRLVYEEKVPDIQQVEVYTTSVWKETEVKVEWANSKAEEKWQGHFEIYNGELESVEALAGNVTAGKQFSFSCNGKPGSVKLKLRHTYNENLNTSDRTIVTMRSPSRSFSFLVNDVVSGENIFVKDYDILVTKFSDRINYAEFEQKWKADQVTKTIYDRIKEMPEQTFENSQDGMLKKKDRGYMPLGCEGGRQKFGVDVNGDVFLPKNWGMMTVPGKDTKRLLWGGDEIRYGFGFPAAEPAERFIEDGYLPVMHTKWKADKIGYDQTAFVTLLSSNILSGTRMQGDDPTILLAKVTLTNSGDESKIVKLNLKSKCDKGEKLVEKDGFVFATDYDPARMRYFMDVKGKGIIKSEKGNLSYQVSLAKNESHSIYFKIPFITLVDEKEYQAARNTDYDIEFSKVKKYWQDRVASGTQITTPVDKLNNFYKASVTHIFITDDREIGSDRYCTRAGTFPYGVFPNEACMIISDLSRRGYKKEAEERLKLFIDYQSTYPLPGNFTDQDGVYNGSGGYEHIGYNQHHGWVLWALAEHYWNYRDKEWLKSVAPSIVKACDWIIRQRQNTMKFDEKGEKVLEYGFMPAGDLEDVGEYRYWQATNSYSYFGLINAARALAEINDSESARLLEEAGKYKKDLLRGFTESMILAPVVQLRNGTYIPYIPSRLYCRGREFGWIREVLEGSIHLIRCGVIEPWDKMSTWIIKDHEDNLYISDRLDHKNQFGYTIDNLEQNWFTLGGFSMQSDLLSHPVAYMFRDEPKHFLRGYFNSFSALFYPDICALVEYSAPTVADNNAVWFKPPDETQSTYWLRLMFVRENGDDLYLGQTIPRYWLSDGEKIGIERAGTYFGTLSLQIKSESGKGRITVVLNPPDRNSPKNIYVRLRHPDSKPIQSVTLNGKSYKNFDSEKEWIILPGNVQGVQELVAYY
jgi:hypothetical protein